MFVKTGLRSWSDGAEIGRIGMHMPPRLDRLRFRLQLGLAGLDLLVLAIGAGAASFFWSGRIIDPYSARAFFGVLIAYVLVGLNGGAFAAVVLPSVRRGVWIAVRTLVLAAAGVILAAFFLKVGEQISRGAFLIEALSSGGLLVIERAVFHSMIKRTMGARLHSEVLILDDCDHPAPEGIFVLDAQAAGLKCDTADPLMLDKIGRLLAPADRVVIACQPGKRRQWSMVMKGANIHAEIVTHEFTELGPLAVGHLADASTVVVATGSFDLRQRIMKRLLDVSLASAAMLALAPLLIIVAVAIWLDSPGSILFVQDRVGRGNRLFGIYKFRSMRSEKSDQAGNRSASRDDDRVTRVGRFIRATSIDELPQIFNILIGDMSFVGPRPHALGSLAGDLLFWEVDERYWHRHACKPGLTGLAQVRGFRGATSKQSDLSNRLQADLEYIAGWTIWRDISILLATFRVVVHRNAF